MSAEVPEENPNKPLTGTIFISSDSTETGTSSQSGQSSTSFLKTKLLECVICSVEFKNPDALVLHENEYKQVCIYCGQLFCYSRCLTEHLSECYILLSRGDKNFFCEKCHKFFRTNNILKRHSCMDIEGGVRPPKCKVCGEEFSCREPYLIHMRTHEDPSTRCPHCNKTRDEAQPEENQCQCPYHDMMPVEEEDHSGREKKYECEVCGDRFYTEDGLSRHISQRKIEKVCTCIHCGEVYCYVQRFIIHLAEAHNIKSKSQ